MNRRQLLEVLNRGKTETSNTSVAGPSVPSNPVSSMTFFCWFITSIMI